MEAETAAGARGGKATARKQLTLDAGVQLAAPFSLRSIGGWLLLVRLPCTCALIASVQCTLLVGMQPA